MHKKERKKQKTKPIRSEGLQSSNLTNITKYDCNSQLNACMYISGYIIKCLCAWASTLKIKRSYIPVIFKENDFSTPHFYNALHNLYKITHSANPNTLYKKNFEVCFIKTWSAKIISLFK